MNLQGFEIISSNIDIIRYIFELLTFEEQLCLANVTRQLQWVFKHFIWKQTYKRIEIIKSHKDNNKCQINNCQCEVIIANETHTNSILLDAKQLNEFLNIYSGDIEELVENRGPALNLKYFQNLTCISYYHMQITNHHLELLANNCPKLAKLNIYFCKNDQNKYLIKIGEDLRLNTLADMKNLTHLTLHNLNSYQLKYDELLKIIKRLKLQYLNLNVVDINDDDPLNIAKMDLAKTLQELVITGSFASSHWSTRSNIFLKNFENLQSLTLRLVESASQDVIETLAKTCQQLKQLKFVRTTFENIQQFSVLVTLSELTFNACRDLTYENLKDILNKMNIQKFSSTETEYKGIFENFDLTPTITSLNIDYIKTAQFTAFPNSLRELTWYDDDNEISLICPFIEVLEIVRGDLSIEHLLQLKYLQKITLTQSIPRITFSYLMALLKHPSVRNVHVTGYSSLDLIAEDIPKSLFNTCNINLKTITIPLGIFEYAPSFWFNLLLENRQLQLICFSANDRSLDMKLLFCNLINHWNIPQSFKSFHWAGFKVDCNDLRRNCSKTMNKIFFKINSMPAKDLNYRLIFQYN